MPCWEINTMSVKIEAADKDLLTEAAKDIGLYMSRYRQGITYGPILIENGTAQVSERDMPLLNQLKVAYSKKVVEKVAKSKRWSGKWMRNKEKPTIKLKKY